MTGLTPGMRVEVVTVYTALPAAGDPPPEADGTWVPYTGPGTWKMYGFNAGRREKARKDAGVWSDLCVCNECATDPDKVAPVRKRCLENLHRDDAGDLTRTTQGFACAACRRRYEDDPKRG